VNATAATVALSAPPVTDTYGLPETDTVLISKLRRMDPALYKTITTKDTP